MSKNKTVSSSACDRCGCAFAHAAALKSHRWSLRCDYHAARQRNAGLVAVPRAHAPLLDRMGIDYSLDIGNYHLGSRGMRGFTTRACFVRPEIAKAIHTYKKAPKRVYHTALALAAAMDLGALAAAYAV